MEDQLLLARRLTRSSGHGLGLLLIFLSTVIMTIVTLQMTHFSGSFAMNGSMMASSVAQNVASSAMYAARSDILAKLDANTLNPATWSLSGNLSIPSDPFNLAGGTTVAGTYTATILNSTGNTYLVQVMATAGSSTNVQTELMQIVKSLDCTSVENAIKAGTLASLSTATLTAYAQGSCMVRTMPSSIAPLKVTAGTGTNCNTGTSTHTTVVTPLNLGNTTGTCYREVRGAFTLITLGTYNQGNGSWALDPIACTTSGCEINIASITTPENCTDGTNPCYTGVNSYNPVTGANIANPVVYKVSSTTGWGVIDGGDGDDTISITSHAGGMTGGSPGNDTMIINSVYTDAIGFRTDVNGDEGNDIFYLNQVLTSPGGEINIYGGRWDLDAASGNDTFYFNEINRATGGMTTLHAGGGDDVVICTGFSGGADATHDAWSPSRAACTGILNGAYVSGEGGNDQLFLDGPLTNTTSSMAWTQLYGGSGYNLIYLKGLINSNTNWPTSNGCMLDLTDTGKSLLILNGTLNGGGVGCVISANGNDNVLMVKSGVSISNIQIENGGAYTQLTTGLTSTAEFARIIFY